MSDSGKCISWLISALDEDKSAQSGSNEDSEENSDNSNDNSDEDGSEKGSDESGSDKDSDEEEGSGSDDGSDKDSDEDSDDDSDASGKKKKKDDPLAYKPTPFQDAMSKIREIMFDMDSISSTIDSISMRLGTFKPSTSYSPPYSRKQSPPRNYFPPGQNAGE